MLLNRYLGDIYCTCMIGDMPDLERASVERFLKSYHTLLYGGHAISLKGVSTSEESPFIAVLKDSVVTYWKTRTDPESEPPEFLIELVDYVEKHTDYWFSYFQEQWLM